MTVTLHALATETFAPMLESLSAILDKDAEHAKAKKLDLVEARLAPDMYTLAQQVQQACHHAKDAMTRLSGKGGSAMPDAGKSIADLKAQIERTVAFVRATPAFEGDETVDCSIEIPGNMVIAMDGRRYLVAWALPHFYFHVVTAYDILRHNGVEIGKRDYLRQVGAFIRPKT